MREDEGREGCHMSYVRVDLDPGVVYHLRFLGQRVWRSRVVLARIVELDGKIGIMSIIE